MQFNRNFRDCELERWTQFCHLCREYAQLGATAGVRIRPLRTSVGFGFSGLPEAVQSGVLNNLQITCRIVASALENEVSPERSLALSWWAIRELGLRPSSDLFEYLEDSDIVEIYGMDDIQIFRTFNMFQCVTYTLEDLFTNQWWQLFERDTAVTDTIAAATKKFTVGKSRLIHLFDMAPHWVKERHTAEKSRALVRLKLIAPLFLDNGQLGGYLSAMKAIEILDDSGTRLNQPLGKSALA